MHWQVLDCTMWFNKLNLLDVQLFLTLQTVFNWATLKWHMPPIAAKLVCCFTPKSHQMHVTKIGVPPTCRKHQNWWTFQLSDKLLDDFLNIIA